MSQDTLEHTHTADWDNGTECDVCGEPTPKPCNWGEQCGTFQAKQSEWDWTLYGELLD